MKILFAFLMSLLCVSALADDDTLFSDRNYIPLDTNRVHFGASVGARHQADGITSNERLLVALKFEGLSQAGKNGESWHLFWTRVALAAGPAENGQIEVRGYNIEIVPVTWQLNRAGDSESANLRADFAPITLRRDADLGWGHAAIRVIRIGAMNSEITEADQNHATIIADLFFDILGYGKMTNSKLKKETFVASAAGVSANFGFNFPVTIRGVLPRGSAIRVIPVNGQVQVGEDFVYTQLFSELALALKGKAISSNLFIQPGLQIVNQQWGDQPKDAFRTGTYFINIGFGLTY
jgi:hypothetical protein